ncbi:MAG: InlB B-repeat-containing protein [Chitinispirillales bacterium]|jgi:uncharacterized protein (TIGR02145 family)/uncharacterized repeat protein (TIGR02543 family)|nr:InlB B-repeat-containing protein [Chitinispirillales bacterium]
MTNIKKFLFTAVLTAILFTCEKVPDFCGTGALYDPTCQFCFGSKAYSLCSDGQYNPLTGGCDPNGRVGTRCSDGSVVPLGTPCGGYTLTIAAAPEIGGTLATPTPPAGPTYAAGERVVLIATPKDGYTFAGWAGAQPAGSNAAGNVTTATYTMNDNMPQVTIVAMFKPVGNGRLITEAFPEEGGTVSRSPNLESYSDSAIVTVTATPKPGYTFAGWSGASSSRDTVVTVVMDESKTLVAMFTPVVHTIRVNSNPADGGAVFINGTPLSLNASQNVESEIVVLAREAEGYVFTGWSGSASFEDASSISTTARLSADATITANFQAGRGGGNITTPSLTCTLTVSNNPAEGGNVSLNPVGTIYPTGMRVTAKPIPNAGYIFTGWTGASNSTDTVITITMDRSKALTANFEQDTVAQPTRYALIVSSTGTGATGSGRYTAGMTVNITAGTAPTGYQFKEWTSSVFGVTFTPSADNPIAAFNMPESDVTVTANWMPVPQAIFTITLNANGGTVTPTSGVTGTDGKLATIPTPTRTGYTFDGWFTAATGGTTVSTSTQFTANATIYARWTYDNSSGGGSSEMVSLGGLKWMTKNLDVETEDSWCYGEGGQVYDNGNWVTLTSSEIQANCAKYGRLYTWEAAKRACQQVGKRLPTRTEWDALVTAAGGSSVAGSKLKSSSGWNSYSDISSTDEFGFSALPGGYRDYSDGDFIDAGFYGYWWTATESGSGAYGRRMYDYGDLVYEGNDLKSDGFSARCVED